MNNIIKTRIARLKTLLSKNNIDTFMVLSEENRRYLSGFRGHDTQFDETAGALFISEAGLILATDSRYEEQASQESPLYEIVCCKEGLAKKIPSITKTLRTKRLGFESIRLSYLEYRKISEAIKSGDIEVDLAETENMVETFRSIKDEAEIESIKYALSIAESVYAGILCSIKPGMTEEDAAWLIEKGIREKGAESISFPSIVASGPNSALPHAIPSGRRFMTGEPILFDWGAKINGYCSDISRTVIIGKPDDRFMKIYNTVLDAQRKAIDAVKPGISSKSVDEAARSHIENMGFGSRFGHGLGHGTGLAVHEQPRLSPLHDSILELGMVFTIEPGIYIPGWGGVRIENMVAVRDYGAEILNGSDTALTVLEV